MTPAIKALEAAGVAHDILRYRHDPSSESYGEEAATTLGLDPRHVFKTLLVDAGNGALGVALVPVVTRLDLKAAATALGVKRCQMCNPTVAERATGYVVGGISPLGQRRRLMTVVDASAGGLDRMYVSAGRRGLEIGLSPDDLLRLTGGSYATLAEV